jgi:hypothetical protein
MMGSAEMVAEGTERQSETGKAQQHSFASATPDLMFCVCTFLHAVQLLLSSLEVEHSLPSTEC